MQPPTHIFKTGRQYRHPRYGSGTVVKIVNYKKTPDTIRMLWLGGTLEFQEGSVLDKEWYVKDNE